VGIVPLSEDDQRIFRQIEASFYEHDPEFAQRVKNTPGVVGHAARTMKLAGVGFVVGVIGVVGLLTTSPILSFLAFVLMVASALCFVDAARKAGKVGLASLNEVVKERRESLDGARQRLRDRSHKEE
jgi:hypothetical protein